MRDLGEFESVFKRALRDQFQYEPVVLQQALLITDLDGEALLAYKERVQGFLDPEFSRRSYHLTVLGSADWKNWPDLRLHLDKLKPDLVIAYRLLRVSHPEIVTSLGVYVDTITQVTKFPVLLLPNPHRSGFENAPWQLGNVLVATEHMYADHSLVNYGIRFTPAKETLWLCHVEDQDTFNYFMKAIEKIPELDNDIAREKLAEQLVAMPKHYAEAVAAEIATHQKDVVLKSVIEFGHMIANYRDLITRQPVSLMVFTTKDNTQLAMHNLGYSLAIEFHNMPVLLV